MDRIRSAKNRSVRGGSVTDAVSPRGLAYNRRLMPWTLEGTAGPETGPVEVADPAGLARAVCGILAKQSRLFEWDGRTLSSVHFRKLRKAKVRAGVVSAVGRTRAEVEERLENAAWEQARRGVSVSELLTMTAERIGIHRSTLYRLTQGSSHRIEWTTIWRLLEYVRDEGDRKAILSYILTPEARRVRREYVAYVSRELQRLSAKRVGKHVMVVFGAEKKLWQSFDKRALQLGADERRIRLGHLRVYDALIGWRRLRRGLQLGERVQLARDAYRRELEILRLERRELRRAGG
jgi:hypothetical protein